MAVYTGIAVNTKGVNNVRNLIITFIYISRRIPERVRVVGVSKLEGNWSFVAADASKTGGLPICQDAGSGSSTE